MKTKPEFSENELNALRSLQRERSILITKVPDLNEVDVVMGTTLPGRSVFNKLIKKGLAFETEEPVEEDGFQFTPCLELTSEGETIVERLFPTREPKGRRP